MLLDRKMRTFESVVLVPSDKHFQRNLRVLEKYGKVYDIDIGYRTLRTFGLYSFRDCLKFIDTKGKDQTIDFSLISKVTVGMEV